MNTTLPRIRQFRWPLAVMAFLVWLLALRMTNVYVWQAELDDLRSQSQHRLSLFAAHLQGELAKYEFLPELLATEDRLAFPLVHAAGEASLIPTNQYLQKINDIIQSSDIYLMDTTGLTIAASNWNSERPFVGKNFRYRPYFQEAMKGHLGRYFALGTTSNKRGYYFAYPIQRNRKVLGVVVVKVSLGSIENAWHGGPDEFIVTDPDDVIFLTTNPQWRFTSLHPLSAETAEQIKASLRYHNTEVLPLPIQFKEKHGNENHVVSIQETRALTEVGLGNHEKTESSDKQKNKVETEMKTSTKGRTPDPKMNRLEYLMQSVPIAAEGWTLHVLSSLEPVKKQLYRAYVLVSFIFIILVVTVLFLYQRQRRIQEKVFYEQEVRKTLSQARDELEIRVEERTADLAKTNTRLTQEIEEHRRTEAILNQTQEELIQAAKLAGLGQMSTAISHELNQPLTAIRSYADNAQKFLDLNREQDVHWNLTQISDLTARMAKIIKQFKVFARKSSGQSIPVSFKSVLDGSLTILESQIRQGQVTVETDLPEEDLFVFGDMVRLEQVLVNLISNAVQAMLETSPRHLYIQASRDQDMVVVTLRDTGPGIKEEHLSQIFDPFFTTKETGQGLGLGLAISYQIIDGFKGSLKAINHSEGGAMFIVRLPRPPSVQEEHTLKGKS